MKMNHLAESDEESPPRGIRSEKSDGSPRQSINSESKFQIVAYSLLEKKDRKKAKEVLKRYHDVRRKGSVFLCGFFLKGKCYYITKCKQLSYERPPRKGHSIAHKSC